MPEISLDTMPDNDAWHPSTHDHAPREFDEENLLRLCTHVVVTLNGRAQKAGLFPSAHLLARCQALKVELDLALGYLSRGEPTEEDSRSQKLLAAFENGLLFIWGDGNLTPYNAVTRLAAYTFLFFPDFGPKTQTGWLRFLGLNFKQQFNEDVKRAAEHFNYLNPAMRDAEAKKEMRKAAMRRVTNGEHHGEE